MDKVDRLIVKVLGRIERMNERKRIEETICEIDEYFEALKSGEAVPVLGDEYHEYCRQLEKCSNRW